MSKHAAIAPSLSSASFEKLIVAADARIDGRIELGESLRMSPQQAAAAPAAELIARAWARWGEEALQHLLGDFAFLLWDGNSRSLTLARDFFGERPLHYRLERHGILASTVPSAIAASSGDARVDVFTLARYHAMLPQTGRESFFEGVSRVEPGTLVRWRAGGIDVRRYWRPPENRLRLSKADAADAFRSLITIAVRDRGAERPGAAASHLSGGMDSSAIAASLGDLGAPAIAVSGVSESHGEQPPRGYLFDEWRIAAKTAALYPNLRHVLSPSPGLPLIQLMQDWSSLDQPLRSVENGGWLGATYADAAAAGAGVLMTGEFGNISFSYDGTAYFAELLRSGRVPSLIREGLGFRRRSGARWRGVAAHALGPAIPAWLWRSYFRRPPPRQALLEDTLFRPDDPIVDRLLERAHHDHADNSGRPRASTWSTRAQEISWVDNSLLMHGVRERWGVQLSDPLADRRLVEFSFRLPGRHWLEDGETRALARRVLRGRVAPEVVDPPGRGMQGLEWRAITEACLPQLREEARLLDGTEWGAMIDLPRARSLLDRWPAGAWSDIKQVLQYKGVLLRSVAFGHYARVRSA